MKNIFHPTKLPFLVTGAGVIGLLLRLWLQLSGTDSKGFLISGHPARILLWLLSGAVLVLVLFLTWNLKEANKYRFNFPASPVGAIGTALGAAGIGITSAIELIAGAVGIDLICALLGILATFMLLIVADCRQKGRHPSPLMHTVVCLFFMVRLISFYRHWSADPKLLDYVFQLLATVCVMLSCYQRAVFDANFGSRRAYAFFSLAGIYCCALSLVSGQDILLFLSLALWLLTNLCSLKPAAHQEEV